MKKIISLILGFALFCCMPAGAEESQNAESLSRETDIVKALGMMDGIEKTESGNLTVSRIEFAATVARLAGISGSKEQIFSDVAAEMQYSKYVSGLCGAGILNKAENFRPNAPITGAEAIKMTVCVLGYKYLAELNGGFPGGYFMCASKIGLYNKLDSDSPLTVNQAGKMIYSTFEIDALTLKGINDGNIYETFDGETLPKINYGITKHFGLMTENTMTSLTQPKGSRDNKVKIDGREQKIKAGLDADGFLGENTEYYIKETDGETEVVYITSKPNTDTVYDFLLSDVEYENGSINYYVNGRKRSVKISSEADYIYNRKAEPGYSLSSLPDDNGTLRAIDSGGNGQINVLKIMHYKDRVLKSHSEYFESLNFDDGTKIELSGKTFDIFDKTGKKISFEEISEDSVISVAQSGDSEYFEFVACDDIAAGKVEKTAVKNGKDFVYINGEEHRVYSGYKTSFGVPAVGEYYMFYLDFMGYIVKSDNKTIKNRSYGYLLGISVPKKLENKAEIKLMDEQGKVRSLKSSEYITFNGEQKDSVGNRFKGADLKSLVSNVSENGKISQLIVYKTNSENEICYVETANSTAGNDAFIKNSVLDSSNGRYVSIQNSFFLNYGVNDNTKIFVASADESGTVDEENIKMISPGELINNKYYTGAEIYDADGMNIAGAVVIPLSAEYIYADNVMLVNGVQSVFNSEKYVSRAIEGLYCGDLKTLCISDLYEAELSAALDNLNRGDIIRLLLNNKDEILGFEVLFSSKSSDRNELFDSASKQLYRLAYNYYVFGSVINRSDDLIYMAIAADGSERSVYKLDSKANIYIYDSKTKKITKSDISCIETYGESFMTGGQRVFIKFRYDVIYDLIILT